MYTENGSVFERKKSIDLQDNKPDTDAILSHYKHGWTN